MDYIGKDGCTINCWLIAVILLISTTNASTFSEQQKLYSDLKKNMNAIIRPVENQSDTVNVMLTASLMNILSLDEKEQLLSSTIALQLSWTYETLQWQPSLYGGANIVRLLPSTTWLPDLTYMNSVGNNQELNRGDYMKVTVAANGQAMYFTGGNLDTMCEIDITKYPFDTQLCNIVIGKVVSSDDELIILPTSNKVNTDNYEQNGEWNLVDTNVKYKSMSPKMTIVHLELKLQRRALFYTLNIIIPLILVSAMNVLSFKLPTSSGERMGYCISLFLTFVVLLNMVSDEMPKISISVSYLQLYVNIQLTLGVIITTLSMMLVRLANNEGDICQEGWIKRWYSRLHCQHRKDQVEPVHDLEIIADNHSKHNSPLKEKPAEPERNDAINMTEELDNMMAVKFIDKICFWIFLCTFLMSTLVCMLLMVT